MDLLGFRTRCRSNAILYSTFSRLLVKGAVVAPSRSDGPLAARLQPNRSRLNGFGSYHVFSP